MIRSSLNVLSTAAVGAVAVIVAPDQAAGQARRVAKPRAVNVAPARGVATGTPTAAPGTPSALAATAPGIAAAVRAAVAEYRSTGVARPVPFGTIVALPFGHGEPVVRCTVLRACVIELEPGEQIADTPVAGDPVRWSIDSSKAGPGGETRLVLVKPRACDITTNVVVPTDRRIYDLTLDSPACARGSLNPRQAGVRHVRFYYPDDLDTPTYSRAAEVQTVGDRPSAVADDPLAIVVDQGLRSGRAVNRAYRVVRKRRGPFGLFGRKPVDFPWQPSAVADDGAHTYVVLPPGAAPHAAPVLYAVENDGSRTMVNYAVRALSGARVYVADRVVHRAVLVLMAGSREQKLELENRGWGRPLHGTRAGTTVPGRTEIGG